MTKKIKFSFNQKSYLLPKKFRTNIFKLPDVRGYLYIEARIKKDQTINLNIRASRIVLSLGRLLVEQTLPIKKKDQWHNKSLPDALKIMSDWEQNLTTSNRDFYTESVYAKAETPHYTEILKMLDFPATKQTPNEPWAKPRFKKLGL